MAMNLTARSVGLMVATSLAAGWLAASLTQQPAAEQSSSRSGTARAAQTREVPRAEKLRERLADPPLPSRGRNPFVYGPRTTTIRDHQRHGEEIPVAAPAPPPMMPAAPPLPIFRLSGIASNAENGVAVLTAIVIDNGAMVFVKAGDKLSNGYSVVRLDETSVTIVDASGITQTLRLP